MKFVISFLATEFNLLKKFWSEKEILREKQGIVGTAEVCRDNVGGAIYLCETYNKIEDTNITAIKQMRSPYGILINQNYIYAMINRPGAKAGDLREEYILKLSMDNLTEVNKLENRLFSHSHSLTKTSKGYMVASSGLDLIVEVDEEEKIVWEYWFTDHGYQLTPLQQNRRIEKNIDHRKYDYSTLHQTTHVNSAQYLNDEERYVAAVLFHPGELVIIDKKIKKFEIILKNMKCSHHFHNNDFQTHKSKNNKYIISNTFANKVLLLDEKFKVTKEIGDSNTLNWVQDAIYTSRDTILIADSNNNRLVETDMEGRIISTWLYDTNFRIFQVCEYQ